MASAVEGGADEILSAPPMVLLTQRGHCPRKSGGTSIVPPLDIQLNTKRTGCLFHPQPLERFRGFEIRGDVAERRVGVNRDCPRDGALLEVNLLQVDPDSVDRAKVEQVIPNRRPIDLVVGQSGKAICRL